MMSVPADISCYLLKCRIVPLPCVMATRLRGRGFFAHRAKIHLHGCSFPGCQKGTELVSLAERTGRPLYVLEEGGKVLKSDPLKHAEGNWEDSCQFTLKASVGASTIEIELRKLNTHPCSDSSIKVKSLGNEAVECRRMIAAGEHAETIAGRMRDVYFVASLTNVSETPAHEPASTRSSDRDNASKAERVAEQVVGNLY